MCCVLYRLLGSLRIGTPWEAASGGRKGEWKNKSSGKIQQHSQAVVILEEAGKPYGSNLVFRPRLQR
jgi:hypothetical protein